MQCEECLPIDFHQHTEIINCHKIVAIYKQKTTEIKIKLRRHGESDATCELWYIRCDVKAAKMEMAI